MLPCTNGIIIGRWLLSDSIKLDWFVWYWYLWAIDNQSRTVYTWKNSNCASAYCLPMVNVSFSSYMIAKYLIAIDCIETYYKECSKLYTHTVSCDQILNIIASHFHNLARINSIYVAPCWVKWFNHLALMLLLLPRKRPDVTHYGMHTYLRYIIQCIVPANLIINIASWIPNVWRCCCSCVCMQYLRTSSTLTYTLINTFAAVYPYSCGVENHPYLYHVEQFIINLTNMNTNS